MIFQQGFEKERVKGGESEGKLERGKSEEGHEVAASDTVAFSVIEREITFASRQLAAHRSPSTPIEEKS